MGIIGLKFLFCMQNLCNPGTEMLKTMTWSWKNGQYLGKIGFKRASKVSLLFLTSQFAQEFGSCHSSAEKSG